MKHRIFTRWSLVAGLAVAAGGLVTVAQAEQVYWSIGLSSPGVQVGVANAAPLYAVPPPVVYARPAPVVLAPYPQYVAVGWQPPGYAYGWKHRKGHRHHKHDRFDHWDDGGRWERGGRN